MRRIGLLGLAAVVLTMAVFGAFGHVHLGPDHHHGQPCAACATFSLLTAGLASAVVLLAGLTDRVLVPPTAVLSPFSRRLSGPRAQRAPPSA